MKKYICENCKGSNLEIGVWAKWNPYWSSFDVQRIQNGNEHYCIDCDLFNKIEEIEINEE